ncbi:MAG: hypothetical protein IT306_12285 [Chloroflexi bacterium]|nr:hypothetical protein [Chloroflexota bacterium]
MLMHHRDLEQMLAAIAEQETLEAQLAIAARAGAEAPVLHRLGERLNEVLRREVEAEGESGE